jgi:hypothetical protein
MTFKEGKSWFKFVNGLIGVSLTIMWFVFMIGSPVIISLGGVPVAGSLVFSLILLGNGYGLWTLGKEGHTELQAQRQLKARAKAFSEYHRGREE